MYLKMNHMKNIVYYGADWCPDCQRTKGYLKSRDIEFKEVDVAKEEVAAEIVQRINNGKRIIPTLIIDGMPHANPSLQDLAQLVE